MIINRIHCLHLDYARITDLRTEVAFTVGDDAVYCLAVMNGCLPALVTVSADSFVEWVRRASLTQSLKGEMLPTVVSVSLPFSTAHA
jgi:tetrahydromethanopterin S-methyltransferase subunit D